MDGIDNLFSWQYDRIIELDFCLMGYLFFVWVFGY